ncbi:MAG TPA: hypothetical protein IAB17_00985 [Candidatus Alectryocaccobium stercorigallinarum]|nr:hypothetical protein [Candidatus Alectryocaccobium stercorigallinarum]
MKKSKNTALIICCIICSSLLIACGGQNNSGSSTASSSSQQSTSASEPKTTQAADAEATNTESTPQASEPVSDTLSGQLNEEASAPVGDSSLSDESTPAASQTQYGSGLWYVYAQREGDGRPETQELQFQDGKLLLHFYSLNDYGKGGYGEGCSDELQFSPYVDSTLEEAVTQLESEGYTVTIQQ